jgi:putative ABC transport system substrate-binding protein
MIRRREFIAGLGGAVAWPLAARGQQRPMPVIGYLSNRSADSDASMLISFRRGLADVGYAEGRNVAVEYHFADGRYDRIPAMAADLVSRRVGVIAASATLAALAVKAETATIPTQQSSQLWGRGRAEGPVAFLTVRSSMH